MPNIHVINVHTKDCSNESNYYYCGGSSKNNPLANPFTFNGKHTSLKKLSFKTREEAVSAYEKYFDVVYNQRGYETLTQAFNSIYKHYKNGEDVYLACTCSPNICHCDVLAKKLQQKLIREKMVEKQLG